VETDEAKIRLLLQNWTDATRQSRQDDVLAGHADDVVIYDVLPPLRYTSAAGYRASWDEWQPETEGEMKFELEDLSVFAGDDAAFAYGILQCGGTLVSGVVFRDTVRATFCLKKVNECWVVVHQHLSKPFHQG